MVEDEVDRGGLQGGQDLRKPLAIDVQVHMPPDIGQAAQETDPFVAGEVGKDLLVAQRELHALGAVGHAQDIGVDAGVQDDRGLETGAAGDRGQRVVVVAAQDTRRGDAGVLNAVPRG
jgi:hypothetical protein